MGKGGSFVGGKWVEYGKQDQDDDKLDFQRMNDEEKEEELENRRNLLRKTERIRIKDKADYILEKSKLSEKELLAEVLFRLVSIEQSIEHTDITNMNKSSLREKLYSDDYDD
jgi:hypothetical protein